MALGVECNSKHYNFQPMGPNWTFQIYKGEEAEIWESYSDAEDFKLEPVPFTEGEESKSMQLPNHPETGSSPTNYKIRVTYNPTTETTSAKNKTI